MHEPKSVLGTVIGNFFGVVTVKVHREIRSFKKGDEFVLMGRYKFPVGSLVGIYFDGVQVTRVLALVK